MADAPADDAHSSSVETVLEEALQGSLQPDTVLAWLHAAAQVSCEQAHCDEVPVFHLPDSWLFALRSKGVPPQLGALSRRAFASALAFHIRDEAEAVLGACEEARAAAQGGHGAGTAQPPPPVPHPPLASLRPPPAMPGDVVSSGVSRPVTIKQSTARRLEAPPEVASPRSFDASDFPSLSAAAALKPGRRIQPTAMGGVTAVHPPGAVPSAPVVTAAAPAAPSSSPTHAGGLLRSRSGEASLLPEDERAALREARKAALPRSGGSFGAAALLDGPPVTPRQGHAGRSSSISASDAEPPASPATPLLAVFSAVRIDATGGGATGTTPTYTATSPGDTPADAALPPPRDMGPRTRVAASLMAAVLSRGLSPVSLGSDIVLLSRLLAAPRDTAVATPARAPDQQLRTLRDVDDCAAFAAHILSACFPMLVPGLGERLLAALSECSQLRRYARTTARAASTAAGELRAQAQACRRYGAGGVVGGAASQVAAGRLGLELEAAIDARRTSAPPPGTDGRQPVPFLGAASHEQAFHNREKARDELYSLLEDLAGNAGVGSAFGGSSSVPPTTQVSVAVRARELLARLRPDNLIWLACLLAARALAAATQGETDEEVGTLAAARPDRLQRLHARIMSDAGSTSGTAVIQPPRAGLLPGAQGLTYKPPPPPAAGTSNGGAPRQLFGSSTAQSLPGSAFSSRVVPSASGFQRSAAGGGGQQHLSMGTMSVAQLFPPTMRPIILFLEAADSARLNAALMATLLGALHELDANVTGSEAPRSTRSSGASVTDRVLALRAIGMLLGVLHFGPLAQCVHGTSGGVMGGTQSPPLPVDCASALRRATQGGTLTRTAPWVLCFLRLVPWTQTRGAAPITRDDDVTATLRRLAALASGAGCRVVRPTHDLSSVALPGPPEQQQGRGQQKAMSVGTLCVAAACGAFFDDWAALSQGAGALPPGVAPPARAPPPLWDAADQEEPPAQPALDDVNMTSPRAPGGATSPSPESASPPTRTAAAGAAAAVSSDVDDAVDAYSAVFDDRFTDAVCPALGEATRVLVRSAAVASAQAGHSGSPHGDGQPSGGGPFGGTSGTYVSRRITALPPRPTRDSSGGSSALGASDLTNRAMPLGSPGAAADPTSHALRTAFWSTHAELRRLGDMVTDTVARSCAAHAVSHASPTGDAAHLRDVALSRADTALRGLIASSVGRPSSSTPGAGPRPAGFDSAVERLAVEAARQAATPVAQVAAALARRRSPDALASMLAPGGEVAAPAQLKGELGIAAALVAEAAAAAAHARVMSFHATDAVEYVRKAARKMLTQAAASRLDGREDPADGAAPGDDSATGATSAAWDVPAASAWCDVAATPLAPGLPGASLVAAVSAAADVQQLRLALAPLLPGATGAASAATCNQAAEVVSMLLAALFTAPKGYAGPIEQEPHHRWMATSYLPGRLWAAIAARAAPLLRASVVTQKAAGDAVCRALFDADHHTLWRPSLRLAGACSDLAYRVETAFPALVHAMLWDWTATAGGALSATPPETCLALDAAALDDAACAWFRDAQAHGGVVGLSLARSAARACLAAPGPRATDAHAAALLPRLAQLLQ